MKRLLLILLLVTGYATESRAQSWGDMLKSLFGMESKEEKELQPEVKYMTTAELLKTWVFSEPKIDYTGSDPVATMAVSALEGQIDPIMAKSGIQRGRDRVTFHRNLKMTIEIDKFKGEGGYAYNPATGEITLTVAMKGQQVSMSGSTEYKDGVLTLWFDAGKALETMKAAVPELSENDYVKIASSLIASYPGIRIGGSFKP